MKVIKILCLSALTAIFFTNAANAQKLPGKQEVSLHAPLGIKIDGKATEWNNKFQAYNNATEFFYTIANSDTELYLTVYCVQPAVIRRIMRGGISLIINKSGKKNDATAIDIAYPVFDAGKKFTPVFRQITPNQPYVSIKNERPLSKPVSDSLLNANNTEITAKAKNIAIKGIKGMDSLISVYNDEGIKAAGQFNNKMAYTYEMVVSLKNLGLTASDATKFAYQLKINEVEQRGIYVPNAASASPLEQLKGMSISANAQVGQPATDFWGEYTLIKN